MSSAKPSTHPFARLRVKRLMATLLATLVAGALAIGVPVAAQAVPAPTVTLNSSTATADAQLTVTATGFDTMDWLAISLDSVSLGNNVDADASGDYSGTIYLPSNTTVGVHTITVTGKNLSQTAQVTVVPAPVGTPATVKRTISQFMTSGVTASFAGFTPGDSVKFGLGTGAMGNDIGAPVTVPADGTVSITFNYGDAFPGGTAGAIPYTLRAINATNNILSQFVTITVVADPVAAKPVTQAVPATPVRGNASFTG